ncbi:MFS transporter [Streptosporangium lutulentum]
MALVAFEYLAVATAMPVVADELDGHALYGLAFSGAMAAGVIATVLGGRWSDVKGPIAPLWTGTATFAAGLVVAGLAPTMDLFIAGRFVQGFGEASSRSRCTCWSRGSTRRRSILGSSRSSRPPGWCPP